MGAQQHRIQPKWPPPDGGFLTNMGGSKTVFPLSIKWRIADGNPVSVWAQFGADCQTEALTPVEILAHRRSLTAALIITPHTTQSPGVQRSRESKNQVTLKLSIFNHELEPIDAWLLLVRNREEKTLVDNYVEQLLSSSGNTFDRHELLNKLADVHEFSLNVPRPMLSVQPARHLG